MKIQPLSGISKSLVYVHAHGDSQYLILHNEFIDPSGTIKLSESDWLQITAEVSDAIINGEGVNHIILHNAADKARPLSEFALRVLTNVILASSSLRELTIHSDYCPELNQGGDARSILLQPGQAEAIATAIASNPRSRLNSLTFRNTNLGNDGAAALIRSMLRVKIYDPEDISGSGKLHVNLAVNQIDDHGADMIAEILEQEIDINSKKRIYISLHANYLTGKIGISKLTSINDRSKYCMIGIREAETLEEHFHSLCTNLWSLTQRAATTLQDMVAADLQQDHVDKSASKPKNA